MADLVDSMLDLMRRLPPTRTEENVAALVEICPDYADDLLGSVDQPLQVKTDRVSGKDYLACDYNRDGESYRSPWSNDYDPPLEDGTVPSIKLRKLEIAANEAFDLYREMYYEGGVSSVYLWDLDEGGFAGVVLLKKSTLSLLFNCFFVRLSVTSIARLFGSFYSGFALLFLRAVTYHLPLLDDLVIRAFGVHTITRMDVTQISKDEIADEVDGWMSWV
ncbi:hypothetical protein H1R20_g16173, partial [Candolleomyces eurysporus]